MDTHHWPLCLSKHPIKYKSQKLIFSEQNIITLNAGLFSM